MIDIEQSVRTIVLVPLRHISILRFPTWIRPAEPALWVAPFFGR
jgi:hypothetical protein